MTYKVDKFWTVAADQELARRWLAGETTRLIGQALGCGKNAVIGRARRLGLPSRPSPVLAKGEKAPPKPPAPPMPLPVRVFVLPPRPVSGPIVRVAQAPRPVPAPPRMLADVMPRPPAPGYVPPAQECQWIEGPAKGAVFCGAPTVAVWQPGGRAERSSWCRDHVARVFQRPMVCDAT